MPNVPYGVECKNPDCHTGMILGDMWVEDRKLRQGDRVTFVVLQPPRMKCRDCQKEYEYAQGDLRLFPEAQPQSP